MKRSTRNPGALAALALAVALVAAPLPARSQAPPPPVTRSPDSAFGAAMAMICGASACIASKDPIPIVIAVGAACCLLMYVDAMSSAD
ncbi:MAG TPA: hypothetical protein VMH61_01715 [Candidatus Acidoferrales bacterium]|nr:hypothetical protein [Candidatus Acidoferrales bacterium]